MKSIDLRVDGKLFRMALEQRLTSLGSISVSAIEVGYECQQSGWIFIHADQRESHLRDGEWTRAMEENELIGMPHWADAMESQWNGNDVEIIRIDGSKIVIAAYNEEDDGEEDENGELFPEAIGQMILTTLLKAKADGHFSKISPNGTVQLDIEDFDGYWGWPEFDELGKTNLV